MSEDMSDIMQKMNNMLKNNELPDGIKNLMSQFNNSSNDNNGTSSNSSNNTESSKDGSNNFSNNNSENSNNFSNINSENSANNESSFEMPNFDIGTMMKMKSIIDSMNKEQNDPRANLLKSLKPYLRPSRKEKVDQYIKLFGMGKMIEVLNPLGGEKKNDV